MKEMFDDIMDMMCGDFNENHGPDGKFTTGTGTPGSNNPGDVEGDPRFIGQRNLEEQAKRFLEKEYQPSYGEGELDEVWECRVVQNPNDTGLADVEVDYSIFNENGKREERTTTLQLKVLKESEDAFDMMMGDFNPNHDPSNGQFTEGGGSGSSGKAAKATISGDTDNNGYLGDDVLRKATIAALESDEDGEGLHPGYELEKVKSIYVFGPDAEEDGKSQLIVSYTAKNTETGEVEGFEAHPYVKAFEKGSASGDENGPVKSFTITNSYGQKELRKAKIVNSLKDIPVGLGKVGTTGDFEIWADKSKNKLEFAKKIYAIKK